MSFRLSDLPAHLKGLGPAQRSAWVAIANSVLAIAGKETPVSESHAVRMAQSAAQLSEADLSKLDPAQLGTLIEEAILRHAQSDGGIRDTVQDALNLFYVPSMADTDSYYGPRPWIRDIFDSGSDAGTVVFEWKGDLWQTDFTIVKNADGEREASLADPIEVDVAYVPLVESAPMPGSSGRKVTSLASTFTELSEAAVGPDGLIDLKLIQPGWGDKAYYTIDALKESGPQTFRKGLKMFWNHPTKVEEANRPERDLRDLAAELVEDAVYREKGPKGAGLYAKAKVFGHYRESVADLAPHIGVSIRATGWTRPGKIEGREGNILESFIRAKSADFVTYAGAGGEILNLFESARGPRGDDREEVEIEEGGHEDMALTAEERASILAEAKAQVATELAEARTEIARLKEGAIVDQARSVWSSLVNRREDFLPLTRARLVESMPIGQIPTTETGELDRAKWVELAESAIKAEAKYVRAVSGRTGPITGMGSFAQETLEESSEGGEGLKPEEANTRLTTAFSVLGLSESAAKVAAAGHIR